MSVFEDDDVTFQVVMNHEEQFSIWPDFKPVPAGWTKVGVSGSRQECLAHIERAWTDMRPLSLRRHMEEQARRSSADA
jgi:MbtH protein